MEEQAYYELSAYTLQKHDPEFIHQYVVDAYAASTPTHSEKPIRVAFALMGLYLHLEKGYTGRQVQLVHMQAAKGKKDWPVFPIPENKPAISAIDVMKYKEGEERNKAIIDWSKAVWETWKISHQQIATWVNKELNL